MQIESLGQDEKVYSLPAPSAEWNGKSVEQTDNPHAWLVLKLPLQHPSRLPCLEEKVTSVYPTVEQVLAEHNLKLAPTTWGGKEVRQIESEALVIIPLPVSFDKASLGEKITPIDALDQSVIERALELYGQKSPLSKGCLGIDCLKSFEE